MSTERDRWPPPDCENGVMWCPLCTCPIQRLPSWRSGMRAHYKTLHPDDVLPPRHPSGRKWV